MQGQTLVGGFCNCWQKAKQKSKPKRRKEKWKRNLIRPREENGYEWITKEQKDAFWEYLSCRSEIENWEKFLSRFHEREKKNYIKAALEAATTKIKLEAEEKFRSQWWL